jgi:hypothetical protein
VSTEDEDCPCWDVLNRLDKDHTPVDESLHHVFVVDNFVVDVDRLTVNEVKQLLDHIDRHVDPGTEAAWVG